MAKREHSAGGAVYKKEKETLWLLIKPTGRDTYQLPKGWIDQSESSEQASLREVAEEGGVDAELLKPIDSITLFFTNKDKEKVVKRIDFYLMKWLKDRKEGHDWETEKVLWLPFEEATQKLTYKSEKEILKKAHQLLGEVG